MRRVRLLLPLLGIREGWGASLLAVVLQLALQLPNLCSVQALFAFAEAKPIWQRCKEV